MEIIKTRCKSIEIEASRHPSFQIREVGGRGGSLSAAPRQRLQGVLNKGQKHYKFHPSRARRRSLPPLRRLRLCRRPGANCRTTVKNGGKLWKNVGKNHPETNYKKIDSNKTRKSLPKWPPGKQKLSPRVPRGDIWSSAGEPKAQKT